MEKIKIIQIKNKNVFDIFIQTLRLKEINMV